MRCVPGCRRALPAPRASALGARPGWSLSRWRLRAGRKSGPEPAEEPAQACQDPGRARTRQTDRSSSSAGTRAHAAKTANPAAHAASRDLRDHQARQRTSASKSAVAVLTRTLITQCGQPAGASRACNRRYGASPGQSALSSMPHRTVDLASHAPGPVIEDDGAWLRQRGSRFLSVVADWFPHRCRLSGDRVLIFGLVEDRPHRLACGEDALGGQSDLADDGVGLQLGWMTPRPTRPGWLVSRRRSASARA